MLDGDRQVLRANGRTAARDIVQFVPLNRTQRDGGAEAVARELLAEIPGQVVGYFYGLKGVQPGGARPFQGQGLPHQQQSQGRQGLNLL